MKSLIMSLASLLLTTTAQAQLACDARTKMVTELNTKYSESQTGYGISLTGKQILELFTSNTGTWTILLTRPNGTSCAMAAGNSWTDKIRQQPYTPG